MANPQKENGYIPVANEIAEKLARFRISGQEYQILWVILRKTWGWQKKEDEISLSQIVQMTGMKRSQVCRSIRKLVSKRILGSIKKDTTFANLYRFNKDYDQWVASPQRDTPVPKEILEVVPKRIPKVVPKEIHTKETSKETNTKVIQATKVALVDKVRFNPLGGEIIKAFEGVDPKNKTYYGNKTQRAACNFLIETYGLEEVLKRILVLPKTNKIPYFPKINSPNDLKEKWVKLQDTVDAKRAELKNNKNKIYGL